MSSGTSRLENACRMSSQRPEVRCNRPSLPGHSIRRFGPVAIGQAETTACTHRPRRLAEGNRTHGPREQEKPVTAVPFVPRALEKCKKLDINVTILSLGLPPPNIVPVPG